jgi:hypothetical protein
VPASPFLTPSQPAASMPTASISIPSTSEDKEVASLTVLLARTRDARQRAQLQARLDRASARAARARQRAARAQARAAQARARAARAQARAIARARRTATPLGPAPFTPKPMPWMQPKPLPMPMPMPAPAVTASRYVSMALPIGRLLMRRGFRPFRAARLAAARVNTPAHLYPSVVGAVRATLRSEQRPGRFLPWLFGWKAPAATMPAATTPAATTQTPAGAIPNYMISSGAFQFAPGTAQVPGMQMPEAPVEDPMLSAEGAAPGDEDLMLEEETPFYKRPLVILAAAGIGYYAWTKYGKKGGKKGGKAEG